MVIDITTPQIALSATWTEPRRTVYINGVVTEVEDYSTNLRHQSTATATISLLLPRADHIVPNAEVEIWDGYGNLSGVRFWGRLPSWTKGFSVKGNVLTLNPLGWTSLLSYRERFDLTWDGPIALSAIFDAVCLRRGVPSYRADTVLDDESTEVKLGGNPYIDDGKVTIPASQSPLAFLRSAASEFGYAVYDDALGTVRLSRISGSPSSAPKVMFTEGESILEARQDYDINDIVNYFDVEGPTYEDAIGRSVPIRAIPESVPSDPLIPVNDGVNYEPHRNSLLVTQQLAEMVRRRLEIDNRSPSEPVRWETVGVPGISPGDVVAIGSDTLEIEQNFWVTSIDTRSSDDGLISTYEGWVGGSTALPDGIDRIVIPIQGPAIHLGDETVPWYAHPAPQGLEKTWDFTIPLRATAVNVVFDVHGSNSQYIGGKNEDLTVSKWSLYKLPIEDPEDPDTHSQGSLPILDENYAEQPNYAGDPSTWSQGAVALKGFDEQEVQVRLKLESGKNSKATLGPQDDFEVRNVYVEIYGTVEPVVIPSEN